MKAVQLPQMDHKLLEDPRIAKQALKTILLHHRTHRSAMDKGTVFAGIFLLLAGLTGIVYGVGVNLQGMMARGASDYSFISAYITEWVLVLFAGLTLIVAGTKRK